MKYYEDPILGKGRAADVSGGTGSATEYVGGYRITIAGQTISNDRYMPIETVTGNSVTMQAGHAYKVVATASAVTLNTETIPANSFGLEGHLEIFVAGTGYIVTGTNVVLANALEPDAVNNCTVRFHDGMAIISVEDHVAGYIVVSATGTSAGSLYYGLSTASQEYIAVDASLNGQVLDLGGVTTSAGEKHVVGNGYSETILTGAVTCTSKTTFANLGMSGTVVTGGTMTLGDVYIPQGATVSVSGGGLAIEKVTGNGGTIDLGNKNIPIASGTTMFANGCVFKSGHAVQGGAIDDFRGRLIASNCTFSSSVATSNGGAIECYFAQADVSDCTVIGNAAYRGGGIFNSASEINISNTVCSGNHAENFGDDILLYSPNTYIATLNIQGGCRIGEIKSFASSAAHIINIGGSNIIDSISKQESPFGASVTISSGAILDFTGNTNTTPFNPGGGVIVDGGTCTVLVGSTVGVVESSVIIEGGTYATIKNDGTTTV